MNNEERAKRIKDRQDKFLADIAEDLLDESTIKSTEEIVKKIFKKNSIPYTRASLKAFSEGSQIILAAQHGGGDQVALGIVSATRKLIEEFEKRVNLASNRSESDSKIL